jgi:hypothetical protein
VCEAYKLGLSGGGGDQESGGGEMAPEHSLSSADL